MNIILRYIRNLFLALLVFIGGLILLSAVSNIFLPRQSHQVEQLSEADELRLMESLHLREEVGNDIWQGFADVDIPILIYNESYAFLIGYDNPPDGWQRVPSEERFGGEWQVVPDDLFNGEAYYRQAIDDDVVTDAFIVSIDGRYVASFPTYEWLHISMWNQLRDDLPPIIDAIFPYRVATYFLLNRSDGYIAMLTHEDFHAYQASLVPERFDAAEEMNSQYSDDYPWNSETCTDAWQTELDLLYNAVAQDDPQYTLSFLEWRDERRNICQLTPPLIRYEQAREWVEGSAKYVELQVWQSGATAIDYTPFVGIDGFNNYNSYQTIWNRELDQLRRMADASGDGRFYYTGFAQAVLLDRYMPDWQSRIFEDDTWFDTLLMDVNMIE